MNSLTTISSILFLLAPIGAASELSPSKSGEQLGWYEGPYMSALGEARHDDRMLCVYFWSGGSPNCERMYRETLQDPQTAQILSGVICFSADAGNATGARLLSRYNVSTVPTILVLSPDGEPQDAIIGFADLQAFAAEIKRIQSGEETVATLRKLCADKPDDLSLRLRLSIKLGATGAEQERLVVLESIRKADPRGKTLVGARLALWSVRDPLQLELKSSGDAAKVDLRPMYEHIRDILHASVRLEAWEWVADTELARGDRKKGRAGFLSAWSDVPEVRRLEWGSGVVLFFWNMREELSAPEKAAIRDMASVVEQEARKLLAETESAGEPDDASEEERNPKFTAAMALSARACALFMSGKRSGARKLAKEALALSPTDSELIARLAPILSK